MVETEVSTQKNEALPKMDFLVRLAILSATSHFLCWYQDEAANQSETW